MKTPKINRLYISSVISGILLFLSFPNIDLSFLAWIAMIPFLFYLYGKDKKESFFAGLIFGFVYFFGTLYWIYHALNRYGSISFVLSIIIVAFLCLYLALYPALFALLFSRYTRKTNLPISFFAPILWTVLEYIRSYLLTGFPWSSIGYSQYKLLSLIQLSDITGIYGISFIVVAFNSAVVDILLLKKRQKERPLFSVTPTIFSLIFLAFLLTFSFSYGLYRLNQDREGSNLKVAIIQGSIEQDKKWEPAYQREVIEIYKELSLKASYANPDLIVWPETAVPFYFGKDKYWTDLLLNIKRELNSYLLFGSVLMRESKSDKGINIFYTNSAVLLNRDGNIVYAYDKIHLVPFGEYVPLRSLLFFINKITYGIGDYTPGNSYLKANTPFGSFGTLICYEIIFPGLVRKFFLKDGDFIVTITNDAWFGKTSGPYQHFSMAVFRAIENRKPVIRVANTGISGFIDSSGRIIKSTSLFERTYLVETIKTDRTRTFYSKYGDIFVYICLICTIFVIMKKRR